MEVEKIFDYVEQECVDTGITVAVAYEEVETDSVENDFVPKVEGSKTVRRIATYISWYTEVAWLYIEKGGAGIEEVVEILELFEDSGFNPYEFDFIGQRKAGKIEINSLSDEGFEVVDRKEGIKFSSASTDNPQEIE